MILLEPCLSITQRLKVAFKALLSTSARQKSTKQNMDQKPAQQTKLFRKSQWKGAFGNKSQLFYFRRAGKATKKLMRDWVNSFCLLSPRDRHILHRIYVWKLFLIKSHKQPSLKTDKKGLTRCNVCVSNQKTHPQTFVFRRDSASATRRLFLSQSVCH